MVRDANLINTPRRFLLLACRDYDLKDASSAINRGGRRKNKW